MRVKYLETIGEIRLDLQQHRICCCNVLCFLTSTSIYAAVVKRFTKLATWCPRDAWGGVRTHASSRVKGCGRVSYL